jgi:hypothetical protein
MSDEPKCRWVSSDQPRVLAGRHGDECPGGDCAGCQRCEERHCGICRYRHAEVTCAECLSVTRETLREIAIHCDALPLEVLDRHVNGEAMMLAGPFADPEAWRFRAMSALMGRVDAAYLEDCRDELHPGYVLDTWTQLWREHLDQPTDLAPTLDRLVDYLDREMTDMARREEPPFEDFAGELRACLAHLCVVLHDQNQGDEANIGCFECGDKLERRLLPRKAGPTRAKDTGGFEDHWTCKGCHRRYTYAEYNFALRAHLEAAKEPA